MIRKSADLFLTVAWALGTVPVVLALSSLDAPRVVVGLPFVLFLPGYSLLAALYPRRNELEGLERLALSFGMSIAVVPLIGVALNYSPWGVRLEPILAFVALFIVLAAAVAAFRRGMLPAEEAFGLARNVRLLPRWPRARLANGLLALALVAFVAGLGMVAHFATTSRGSSEGFTEFYLLGPGGRAEGYPGLVKAGEHVTAVLGLVNHEQQDTAYRIAVSLDGDSADEIDGLVLAEGERWEKTVALLPAHAGDSQKAEFLLYKDGGSEPYRSLHLWLNVESVLSEEAAPTQRPASSPTPAASPTAAPSSADQIAAR